MVRKWWRRFGDSPKERLLRMVYSTEFSKIVGMSMDDPENLMEVRRRLELRLVNWGKLYRAVKELPGRKGQVLFLRSGIDSEDGRPKTRREIAKQFGVSQTRISDIEFQAIFRLRRKVPFETVCGNFPLAEPSSDRVVTASSQEQTH